MASVKFKQLPPDAKCEEICRYINYLVEELTYILGALDDENTIDEYVTVRDSKKNVAGAVRYAAADADNKIKQLRDEIIN